MKQIITSKNSKGEVWFVYDGKCPICQMGAKRLKINKAVGDLNLIDARAEKSHPVVQEINYKGLNLDEGMVIKFNDVYYHGADALQVMAMLGTNQGWFNRMNYLLFRSPSFSHLCYPSMRLARNIALTFKGVPKLNNLHPKNKPIFQAIFDKEWEKLPTIMRKHYGNHPYSLDESIVEGTLDVMCKWYIKPFLWLFGTIPPYNEKNVPVTVRFSSQPDTEAFCFERIFMFKNRKPFHFSSRMYQANKNEVMEVMNYGICWHSYYFWDEKKVILCHKGYSLSILGINIALPITWLMGRGSAEEIALDDYRFYMCAKITHPFLGKIYEYKGQFKVIKEI